jgi:hypothetical protein
VFVLSQTLAYYRQHTGSSCHNAQLHGAYDPNHPNRSHFVFLVWLKRYLAQENIRIEAVDYELQLRLRMYYKRKRLFFWCIWVLIRDRWFTKAA